MENRDLLVEHYIAAWNETDAKSRRELIDRTWTENGTYIDPLMRAERRQEIDSMIAGVQSRFPGLRFKRTTGVDAHDKYVRFGWELGPENGPALAGGVDFGVIADGKLESITGFLDFAPSQAAKQE